MVLFEQIISPENLYLAAHQAALGKRFRENIADWKYRLEPSIQRLHQQLKDETYRPGRYRMFRIYDPKERDICVAPFRDRVVHHAVHDLVEPFIDKTFIFDSYACRKGKGSHGAIDRAQSFLRANTFCFHGDIMKYFPSINHEILKRLIRMKIMEPQLLALVDHIVDSANNLYTSQESTGLPIGNLTSQFFANLYLNELDRFIKIELRHRYYIRYMDDFLVFSNERAVLEEMKEKIRNFLREGLKLKLHEQKSQIFACSRGITFLGFRLLRNKRRLASKNVRRVHRRIKEWHWEEGLNKKAFLQKHIFLRCWFSHAQNGNSTALRRSILKKVFGV